MWEPTVESVMTRKVVTAQESTGFKELVALMTEHGISGIPVVDYTGRPVGVVSEADTLAKEEYDGGSARKPWLGRRRRANWRKAAGLRALELMTTPAITILDSAPITAAARSMAQHKVRRLCVVNSAGELVGVISRRDIIATYLRADDEILADIERHVLRQGMWHFPATVTADVEDGVVTLEGEVRNRTTAQVAAQLTQRVPGVIAVKNKIRFEVDDTVTAPL